MQKLIRMDSVKLFVAFSNELRQLFLYFQKMNKIILFQLKKAFELIILKNSFKTTPNGGGHYVIFQYRINEIVSKILTVARIKSIPIIH